jgi:hypothetical protein
MNARSLSTAVPAQMSSSVRSQITAGRSQLGSAVLVLLASNRPHRVQLRTHVPSTGRTHDERCSRHRPAPTAAASSVFCLPSMPRRRSSFVLVPSAYQDRIAPKFSVHRRATDVRVDVSGDDAAFDTKLFRSPSASDVKYAAGHRVIPVCHLLAEADCREVGFRSVVGAARTRPLAAHRSQSTFGFELSHAKSRREAAVYFPQRDTRQRCAASASPSCRSRRTRGHAVRPFVVGLASNRRRGIARPPATACGTEQTVGTGRSSVAFVERCLKLDSRAMQASLDVVLGHAHHLRDFTRG